MDFRATGVIELCFDTAEGALGAAAKLAANRPEGLYRIVTDSDLTRTSANASVLHLIVDDAKSAEIVGRLIGHATYTRGSSVEVVTSNPA